MKMEGFTFLCLSMSIHIINTHSCMHIHIHRHYANVIIGETDSFQVNHVYKDEDTYTLVAAASEVLGK